VTELGRANLARARRCWLIGFNGRLDKINDGLFYRLQIKVVAR
jgi:hypothetical protein